MLNLSRKWREALWPFRSTPTRQGRRESRPFLLAAAVPGHPAEAGQEEVRLGDTAHVTQPSLAHRVSVWRSLGSLDVFPGARVVRDCAAGSAHLVKICSDWTRSSPAPRAHLPSRVFFLLQQGGAVGGNGGSGGCESRLTRGRWREPCRVRETHHLVLCRDVGPQTRRLDWGPVSSGGDVARRAGASDRRRVHPSMVG